MAGSVNGISGMTNLVFYQPTIIDSSTGAIFQGVISVGNRDFPESTGTLIDIYGPTLPPIDARIIGEFSPDQLVQIEETIRKTLLN